MTELLTTAPVPALPRNLAAYLAPWLEGLGFAVVQEDNYRLTQLQATWVDGAGQEFVLLYCHYHPKGDSHSALVSLHLRPAAGEPAKCLLSATHIRKTAEVRFALLHNYAYKQARQAALDAGTLLPISQLKKRIAA